MHKTTINNHTVYIAKDYAVNEYNTALSKDEKHDLKQAIQKRFPNVIIVFYRHKKDSKAWKTVIN